MRSFYSSRLGTFPVRGWHGLLLRDTIKARRPKNENAMAAKSTTTSAL